jgi:hypothetical protein
MNTESEKCLNRKLFLAKLFSGAMSKLKPEAQIDLTSKYLDHRMTNWFGDKAYLKLNKKLIAPYFGKEVVIYA